MTPAADNSDWIKVRNLVKDFPGIRALDGVSLSIARASVHGVVGENGAGKSTLMEILSGVEQPTAGDVVIDCNAQAGGIGSPQ